MNSFPFNSYFGIDYGFDSDDTDFDELDCSDPLAMVSHGYRFVKHHLPFHCKNRAHCGL